MTRAGPREVARGFGRVVATRGFAMSARNVPHERPVAWHNIMVRRSLALTFVAACGSPPSPPPADTPDAPLGPVDAAPDACRLPFPPNPNPPAAPPFDGTVFLAPGLFTDGDPTSFASLTPKGRGIRTMFDRRTNSFNEVDARLFDARFGTTVSIEIQVNPELDDAAAEAAARFYATAIGRLPAFQFADLQTVWMHRGLFPFGGGNNNLLIHTEQGDAYVADGFLEEVFLHESSHTSLDAHHAATARWQEAQTADAGYISTYARDNPTREDVAESLVPYLAQKYRPERLAAGQLDAIRHAMPNRITYFDCLGLTLDRVP